MLYAPQQEHLCSRYTSIAQALASSLPQWRQRISVSCSCFMVCNSVAPHDITAYADKVSRRDFRQGGYSADRGSFFLSVGPWSGANTPGRWGRCRAPATVRLYYAGTRRSLPGNSAFHAHYFPSPGPAEMAFLSCFHLICWYVFSNIDGSECPIISATALMSASYSRALVGKACRKL